MNKILPETPIKFAESKMPFKQMENIGKFLGKLNEVGVPAHDHFMTVDLFEAKNLEQVINCIFSLSRHAANLGFDGPILGPKLTQKNERTFTQEQLNEAKAIPSKLMNFVSPVKPNHVASSGRRAIGGRYLERGANAIPVAAEASLREESVRSTAERKTQDLEETVMKGSVSKGQNSGIRNSSPSTSNEMRDTESPPQQDESSNGSYADRKTLETSDILDEISGLALDSNVEAEKVQYSVVEPATTSDSSVSRTLSITQFKSYAEYKAARAALAVGGSDSISESGRETGISNQQSFVETTESTHNILAAPTTSIIYEGVKEENNDSEEEVVVVEESD